MDFITHRPDMPLTLTGSAHVGLGLWNWPPGALALELLVFGIGVALYATTTVARDRVGSFGLWSLVGFLLVVYVANIYGPPPPSAQTVAWSAEALWLLVLWAYRLERHRSAVPAPAHPT